MKKRSFKMLGIFVLIFVIVLSIGTAYAVQNADKLGATPSGKLAKELGLTVEEATPMLDVFKSIGLSEYTNIEHDELLDNAHFEGEKGYRIESSDISNVILYLNPDSTIYQIKYADNILHENGKNIATISDFVLTNQQQSQLQIISQEAIKSVLKSPSTAEFPNILKWKFGKQDGITIIQSYVDSQNGFGAMTRSEFQLKIKDNEVVSLILDGIEHIK